MAEDQTPPPPPPAGGGKGRHSGGDRVGKRVTARFTDPITGERREGDALVLADGEVVTVAFLSTQTFDVAPEHVTEV